MDRNVIHKLLVVSRCGLMAAGIIFLIISLLSGTGSKWMIISALGCILISNLFYIALIVKVIVSKNIYFLFFQVIRYCSVPDVSINKLSTFIGNHVRHRIRPDYHHFE